MTDISLLTKAQSKQLERLIDATTLRAVLDDLHGICYEKAEHLRANWQDERAAKAWERIAKRLTVAIVAAASERI